MKKIYNKPQMQIVVIKMESVIAISGPQIDTTNPAITNPDGDVMETSRRNDGWDDGIW